MKEIILGFALLFSYTVSISQDNLTATIVLNDGEEKIGYLKKFKSTNKEIKFKEKGSTNEMKIRSEDIQSITYYKLDEEKGISFKYVEVSSAIKKRKKTKKMWCNVIYECEDFQILENFVSLKNKKKKLQINYNSDYPSDFIVSNEKDATATVISLGVSRIKARGFMISPKKRNRKMIETYFKDKPEIIEHLKDSKLNFENIFSSLENYCLNHSF